MVNFNPKQRDLLANARKAQHRTLREPKLISEIFDLTIEEATKKIGHAVLLSDAAWPIYLAVGKAYRTQYNNDAKDDYGSSYESKAKGIAGNDAIHATLNECGIFYMTDQLFASYKVDRVYHDFILSPSSIKLEVKTTSTNYLNLNKNHWRGKDPDVIISLQFSKCKDAIALEFKGWVLASDVNAKNFEFIEKDDPKQSYFRCKFENLNRPTDIGQFLTGLAQEGEKYLATL